MPSSTTPPGSPSAFIVAYYQRLIPEDPFTRLSPSNPASTFYRPESEVDIREWGLPVSSPLAATRVPQQESPSAPWDIAALHSSDSEDDLRQWGPSAASQESSQPSQQGPHSPEVASTFINTSMADYEPSNTSPSRIYSSVNGGGSNIPAAMLGLGIYRGGQLLLGQPHEDLPTAIDNTAPASAPPTGPVSHQGGPSAQVDNMQMRSIATELTLLSISLNHLPRRIYNAIITPGALPSSAYEAPDTSTTSTSMSTTNTRQHRTQHVDRRRFGRRPSVYDDDDGWSLRTWSSRSSRHMRSRMSRVSGRCSGRRGAVSMALGRGLRRF